MDLTIVINTYENHIKYFKKCVSSIPINKNIKLIVIIDEKNKKFQNLISGILIKKKFKNYKITLNHKKGIASSRNKAINLCKTEYITFIDGDDFIYDKKIKFNFLNKKYDLFILNSQLSNNKETEFYIKNSEILTRQQKVIFLKKYFINPRGNSIVTHTWSKIYNLSFLKKNKINFNPRLKVNEDYLFNSKYILKAKKIKLLKKKKLVYHNVSSIKKTKMRHLKLGSYNYKNPLRNLIKVLPMKDQKFFLNKAIQYWEAKIAYFNKVK